MQKKKTQLENEKNWSSITKIIISEIKIMLNEIKSRLVRTESVLENKSIEMIQSEEIRGKWLLIRKTDLVGSGWQYSNVYHV